MLEPGEAVLVVPLVQQVQRRDVASAHALQHRFGSELHPLVQAPFGGGGEGMFARLAGLRDVRAVETLTAPLRLFRRGEPLAIMPNVFVR